MVGEMRRRSNRWRRTDTARSYRRALIMACVFAAGGVLAIVVSVISAVQPEQAPVRIGPNPVAAGRDTPWFNAGSTVFATLKPDGSRPRPADLQCILRRDGVTRLLVSDAGSGRVGSRVVDGKSVYPAVTVGRVSASDRISCSGPWTGHVDLWLLPTTVGARTTSLALAIAGVALLGCAVLTHPRGRSLSRGLT